MGMKPPCWSEGPVSISSIFILAPSMRETRQKILRRELERNQEGNRHKMHWSGTHKPARAS